MGGKLELTDEFKRRAINALYERGRRNADDVAKDFGVSAGAIYYWAKQLGVPIIATAVSVHSSNSGNSSRESKYPLEFRLKAVAALKNRGRRSTAEIAETLGVARSVLYKWRDRFSGQAADEEPNERTGYARRVSVARFPAPQESVERRPSATQAAAENRQLTALRTEHERLAAEAAALRKTIVLLGRGH